jgi:hypothetical protein
MKTDQLILIYTSITRTATLAWFFGILGFLLIQAVIVFFIVLAPELGLYLGRYVLLLLIGVVVFRLAIPLQAPFWVGLLILVVLGDFILNYGFTNFAVGVGSARVTVGELVLMVCLVWIAMRAWSALWMAGTGAALILGYVLIPVVLHLPMNLSRFGMTAARDVLPLLDSLFFFAGVCVVAIARDADQWQVWRHRFLWLLLFAALAYFPFFPFQQTLLMYSPRVTGYQQAVPLVGYFSTGNVLALAGLMATILIPSQFAWRAGDTASRWMIVVAFLIFAFGAVVMQSRATYIVAGVSIVLLAMSGHGVAVRRLIVTVIAIIVALAIVEMSGLEFKGRVGKIGLEMVTSQMESSTGEGGLKSARGGVGQRLRWATYALSRWTSSPETVVAGIGFGEPLTDFRVAGADGRPVVVREPHDSYISVLSRTGLMGFVPWLIFQITLMLKLWQKFRSEHKKKNIKDANYWLWIFMLFMSMLITAIVEPVFESPQFAVPYFFIAGFCLGELARAKAGWVPIVKLRKGN